MRDARQGCGASEQSSCACDVLHPVLEACRSSTVPIVAQRLTPALGPVQTGQLEKQASGLESALVPRAEHPPKITPSAVV